MVTPGSTTTEEDLRAFCAQTLAPYKVPVSIEIRTEALPRNPSGKILKHVLAGSGEHSFVED